MSARDLVLRLGLVLGVLTLYFFLRAPFLTQPLMGEEGMFADLLARSPQGPKYAFMARVSGQEVREIYEHPALMYEAYTRLGQLMWRLAQPSDVWVRVLHSLFQASLLACLAWQAARAQGKAWWAMAALAGVVLTAPLGLSNSVHLQTDTSTGTLFAGLLGLSLALSEKGPRAWLGPALACLALSTVGKQEWFIAAAAALLGAEFFSTLLDGRDSDSLRLTLICLLALLLGQALSCAFDPLNYWGGWGVLRRVGGHNIVTEGAPAGWVSLRDFRIIFLGSYVVLLALSWALTLTETIALKRASVRASMFTSAIFLPFALSTWNPSPRYFAPAWAAVIAMLTIQVARRRWKLSMLTAWVVVGLALSGWQFNVLTQLLERHASVTEFFFRDYRVVVGHNAWNHAQAKDCVPRLSPGYTWDLPIDFMGLDPSEAYAKAVLAKYGKKLCPPPQAPPKK